MTNLILGEFAQDLMKKTPLILSVGHYLSKMRMLAENASRSNGQVGPSKPQRLYLKDMDCPLQWHEYLSRIIPPSLFYLNQSPQSFRGPGAQSTNISHIPSMKDGTPIAPAGDLMSSLPQYMRAANLMCYIGHEGTFTPAHQEMCASVGHNIMVEASNGSLENDKPSTPGSSIWLMTKTADRHAVSRYWSAKLGHNIDLEDHFAQLNAWVQAPFETYLVEQKPGDLILVPPLAAHQVWNRGTRTMKVAWNRTTADTLEMAMDEALEHARLICRDEQYKNKAIIYYTLDRYYSLLHENTTTTDHVKVRSLQEDFKKLFILYKDILLSEMFSSRYPGEKNVETIEHRGNVTCSFCRCNIFNRFLTCPTCAADGSLGEEADEYDICMDCYVFGRSCHHISKLKWVQQFPLKTLRDQYAKWRCLILSFNKNDQESTTSFPTLLNAQSQLPRKTVAHICQEQLKIRPWSDGKNHKDDHGPLSEDSDQPEQTKKRRKSNKGRGSTSCHMCRESHPLWEMAQCESCQQFYCYADLFNAFDITPRIVMEDTVWTCPQCFKICNCKRCRQDPMMTPYVPRKVLLSHDTMKVADWRSVESLVTLSKSNLKWFPPSEASDTPRQEGGWRDKQGSNENLRLDATYLEWNPQTSMNESNELSQGLSPIPIDPQLQFDSSFMSPGN